MKNIIKLICFVLVVALCAGCESWFKENDGNSDIVGFSTPETKLSLHKKRVFVAVPPFALKGGFPEGGIYSGNGVKDGKFYPEKAGTGLHTITYTVNQKSAVDTIEVIGPRKKVINPNCTSCNGNGKTYCSSRITCNDCSGKGKHWLRNCDNCDGSGKVRAWYKAWIGKKDCGDCSGVGAFYRGCTECKESGQLKCHLCKGTGRRPCQQCN